MRSKDLAARFRNDILYFGGGVGTHFRPGSMRVVVAAILLMVAVPRLASADQLYADKLCIGDGQCELLEPNLERSQLSALSFCELILPAQVCKAFAAIEADLSQGDPSVPVSFKLGNGSYQITSNGTSATLTGLWSIVHNGANYSSSLGITGNPSGYVFGIDNSGIATVTIKNSTISGGVTTVTNFCGTTQPNRLLNVTSSLVVNGRVAGSRSQTITNVGGCSTAISATVAVATASQWVPAAQAFWKTLLNDGDVAVGDIIAAVADTI